MKNAAEYSKTVGKDLRALGKDRLLYKSDKGVRKLKRKSFSILFTLVLVLTLCLVTAVANADSGTATFETAGNGTAGWSTEQVHNGYYSAKLYVADGSQDWAGVKIPVDIAIEDIASLSFWEYIDLLDTSGWDVNVILGVDCDGDGVFESDVIDWHIGAGQHTAAALGDDSFVEMDGWGGLTGGTFTPPVTYAGLSGDVPWTSVNAYDGVTYGWWTPDAAGTGWAYFGSMASGPLGPATDSTSFQAWLDGPNDDGRIDKGDRVKVVELVLGGSGSWANQAAFVDNITMNGVTYKLEPGSGVPLTVDVPEIISISVTPSSLDFGTITLPYDSIVPYPSLALTIDNTGTVPVDITTELSPTGTVFETHLYLPYPGTYAKDFVWNGLVGGDSHAENVRLIIPRDYSATGLETATLIFWASASP